LKITSFNNLTTHKGGGETMKKLLVIGMVMVMVVAMSVAASAAVDNTIKMGITFANGTISQGTLTLGTDAGKSDGYVVGEDLGFSGAVSTAGEIICTDLGPQGAITDGRWKTDLRAPVTGGCTAFSLKAYFNNGNAGTATLKAWMMTGAGTPSVDDPAYKVRIYEGTWTAASILAGDAAGSLLWTAPMTLTGTSTTPQYTLSNIGMTAGQNRFYTMSIAVPEPGSMVALFSGLIGLVGFGIRRRK
jgi:hypothetical protein